MPGPSNSTNRFGYSSYVVGPPSGGLGNGVNFISIQGAINQAVADGYGPLNPATILIRPGIYTENISIVDGGIELQGALDLIGAQAVFLTGNISCTITGTNAFSISNMQIISSGSPVISVSGGAVPLRFSLKNCTLASDTGFNVIDLQNTSGTFGFFIMLQCALTSDVTAINANSRTVVFADNCRISGGSIGVFLDSSSRFQGVQATVAGAGGAGIFFATSANQCTLIDCSISALDSAIDMTAGGAANVFNTSFNSTAASGFCIAGTGNLTYCNIINNGTAIALDPAIGVITVSDWKPYAEAGAAPGTGVVKGVCSFDSSQFTVVDGFVQSTISGAFPWVEQNASVTVNPNEGNFSVATISLTLPAQPQPMGTTCKFKVVTNDILTVQGNPGDVLQLGALSGTALVSTSSGDAIELTHYDLGIWIANAAIGNWNITP